MAASAELSNADSGVTAARDRRARSRPARRYGEPAVVQRSARGRLSIIQRRPASLPDRAFVMRRAQRSYGNQVALASVQRSARTVQRACACGGTCESCAPKAAEEQQVVQRQAATAASDAATAPAIPDASEGRPLDAATRQAMEAHTGRDLADVRIHTDTPGEPGGRGVPG